ncbi:PASTA domain-containing protein, partial [Desulfovibrio sp.]|uniref:PASTA domain-containing protein n=1 Tax=Desulfovibrio sp. TaxID=885 RepID=UPI00307B0686
DVLLQVIAEEAVARAARDFDARWSGALVVDVYSGAIVPDATSQAEKDDKPDKDKGRQRGLKLSRLDVPFLAKEDVQTSRPPSMQQPGHLAKASSRVPDVKGKTVRNAVELFARAGIVPELKGTGTRVVRQSPPPGTAWPKEGENVTYILWLSER